MFTNTLRKFASKVLAMAMFVSVLVPVTNSVTAQAVYGNLTVGVNRPEAVYTISLGGSTVVTRSGDECTYNPTGPNTGYRTCQETLATGTYLVEFNDIPGYDTPDPVSITLTGLGGTVLGEYTPESTITETGVLTVGLSHADGGFTVYSGGTPTGFAVADANDCGTRQPNGYFMCSQNLLPGTYLVQFNDVTGYTKPDPISVTVTTAGYAVYGDYESVVVVPTTYTLTVGVSHADGGFTVYNGGTPTSFSVADTSSECGARQPNGYFMCSSNLLPGTYLVQFNDVTDYTTPDPISVVVAENTSVYADYESNLVVPTTYTLTVRVNHANGGFTVYNGGTPTSFSVDSASDCGPIQSDGFYYCSNTVLPGTYLVDFTDVAGYITPSSTSVLVNADETVTGYYSTVPTGTVEVRVENQNGDAITVPAGEWQLKECLNANPGTCSTTVTSGGAGGVYSNLEYATYRIVFPSTTLPAGYTGRTVVPSMYQEMNSGMTSLVFTIRYTEAVIPAGIAYVNVRTTPIIANVRMVTLSPAQPDRYAQTSMLVNATPTYDLADADRFTLPVPAGNGGVTMPTNYYIECPVVPGGYEAPSSLITVNGAVYALNSENLAGTCVYTEAPDDETVTITIDTVNVDDAEIYVDGVVVRPDGTSGPQSVKITTTETHNISFADEAGYITPVDISLPAGSLSHDMAPSQLAFLGYYVATGNLAVAEVNTQNQNGWVYITIGTDPNIYNVGLADTTPTPLTVHFDETAAHSFSFQDRNPDYYLRAVPNSEAGFAIAQVNDYNGTNVTYFQERYTYNGSSAFSNPVQLVGDYIAQANAAFFRARTTNADPIFGDIYLDINGEAAETLVPGAQTWTRIFVSDVVNDDDTTSFESPLTVNTVTYTANPLSYDLSAYTPSSSVYDLESTYEVGGSTPDVTVRLISLNPAVPATAGLTVTMDGSTTATTVDNAGSIEANFANVDEAAAHTFVCPVISGLQEPNEIYIPANVLQPGANVYDCIYAPLASSAQILIETEAVDNVNFEAPVTLTVDGTDHNIGWTANDADPATPATMEVWVDANASNVITYGDMTPYITPAADTVSVTAGTVYATSPENIFNGLYTLTVSTDETVTITAFDNTGTTPAVLTSAAITVNGVNVASGSYTGAYPAGTVLDIEFSTVAGFDTPEMFENGVSAGYTYTTTYTVVSGTNEIEAFYGFNNAVGFNVATQDNQANALTESITYGPTGTETTSATPVFFTVPTADLTSYTINFADRAGFFSPEPVVVNAGQINALPEGVTITNNGTAYVAGTPLVEGETYDIVGTYIPFVTIEKNITNEEVIANNNKRVDYQIIVTRTAPTSMGTLTISLADSIASGSRTLTGSNGGTMSVVSQNGSYSICSTGCGDITAGPVSIALDNQGAQVSIVYQTLSNNAGIPTGTSSDFTNTLTATLPGSTPATITDTATVNVLAAPGGGNNNNTGGGGGGGGGGVIVYNGDMVLEVTKLVSLNNKDFVDASDPEDALAIPERKDSTIYTKVTVKNLGQVSATSIKYFEGFDSLDSLITSDPIENFDGEDGVSFDEDTNIISIDKITVGGEKSFTYEQEVSEDGANGEVAEEYIQLEGFKTTLRTNQDGLTKFGIGDHYPSYLVSGDVNVITDGDKLLLSISTDKASANVGEEVTYTITAENIADFDFSGLVVTWDYDENAQEILNTFGGRDTGREIHWDRGILRPGESVQYQVRTRVADGAPVGGQVRTTARGLVNEVENPSVVEHFLPIIGAVTPVITGVPSLAQTGASTLILLLAALAAYFGYRLLERRRYLAIKAKALRPL